MEVIASAPITIANQPAFDRGGIAVDVSKILCGEVLCGETFCDRVCLSLDKKGDTFGLNIVNIVESDADHHLPTDVLAHTGGRAIYFLHEYLRSIESIPQNTYTLTVHKGISTKGTGLGSSGATAAAAFMAYLEMLGNPQIPDHIACQILYKADFDVPDNSIAAFFGAMTVADYLRGKFIPHIYRPGSGFGCFGVFLPRGFGIPTKEARDILQGRFAPFDNQEKADMMIRSFVEGDTKMYGTLLEEVHDWFVAPRKVLYPQKGRYFDILKKTAKKHGAYGVSISGAGPAMVVVCEEQDLSSILQAMEKSSKECGYDGVGLELNINNERLPH